MTVHARTPAPGRFTAETLIVAAVGMLLFTAGIGNQEPVGFDVRFTIFAQEMLRNGPSWFPTHLAIPYPDYPALSTWLIWIPARIAGEVTRLTAILPTAMASALTLAMTYRLVRPYSRHWAVMAVCFALLTVTFLTEARAVSVDQMLTTVTLGCFMLGYSQPAGAVKPQHAQTASAVRQCVILALLVLGFAVRGPMGAVVPAGVMCSYYAVTRQWRSLVGFGVLASSVLAACVALLLYLAWKQGGTSFAEAVWRMQVAGRIGGTSGPGTAYYLTSGLGNYAIALPVALAVVAVTARRLIRSTRHDSGWRLCACMAAWSAVVLIGLSIPDAKKARYLLPIVPAIAILASWPFAAETDRWLAVIRKVMTALLVLLPTIGLLTVIAAHWYGTHHRIHVELPYGAVLALLLGAQTLTLGIARAVPAPAAHAWFAVVAVASLWIIDVAVREPALVQLHGSRAFVRDVEQARNARPAPLALYRMDPDHRANLYLVNAPGPVQPLFVTTRAEILALPRPCYLVMSMPHARQLAAGRIRLPEPFLTGKLYGSPYEALLLPSRPSTGSSSAAEVEAESDLHGL